MALVGVVISAATALAGPAAIAGASPPPTVTSFPLSTTLRPTSITSGLDGNIWFTETRSPSAGIVPGAIGRITPAGAVTEFGLAQGGADGIAAGSDGNVWFAHADSIGRMTPTGVETEFPIPAGCCAQTVTTGPDGNVWFTLDTASSDGIGRITPAGAITVFPVPCDQACFVTTLTTGPDGNIWYVRGSMLGRISPSGTGDTEFSANPTFGSISAGPDGNVWFPKGSAVGRITPAGQLLQPVAVPSAQPPQPSGPIQQVIAVTKGPDGAVWLIGNGGSFGREAVVRVTPAGTLSLFPVPIDEFGPGLANITAGPDGNVWATVQSPAEIARINLPGGTTTALTTSNSPVVQGKPLTLTATVVAPDLGATPTGSVQFTDNGGNLGSPVPLVGGQAALTTTSLPRGANTLDALYLGAGRYRSSTTFDLGQDVQGLTVLVADPVHEPPTMPDITLSAKLSFADGQSTGGYQVNMFDAYGNFVCTASDSEGVVGFAPEAYCTVSDTEEKARLVAGGHYDAHFNGDTYRAPSSGSAPIALSPS